MTPSRTRTPRRAVALVAVAAVALGAAVLLLGSLFGGDRSVAEADPATAARHRPIRNHRVPRLRVPGSTPASAHGVPAPPSAPPPQLLPARTRLAPLMSLYNEFLEVTELDASAQREVRRILHLAQQNLLRSEELAAQNLAESGSPQGRRERALRDLERELEVQVRPEEAERILAHRFVQELLAWNEPLFEADPRGLVNLREDLAR